MTFLIIILNLFILETLLSVDNAAVLAMMVKDLPKDQQPKALRYGLLGAFAFRGICLFCASWLMGQTWIKFLGGMFLLWLVFKHFFGNESESKRKTAKSFWGTVIMIEIADLSFSVDNVFAAVALTNNIYLILIGVFLGIISMRFIAQGFVRLTEKYPSLTNSAFIVIFLLGVKLIVSSLCEYCQSEYGQIFSSHSFDIVFSLLMMVIFITPIINKKLNLIK